MRFTHLVYGVLFLLAPGAASAMDVPLEDGAFTTYIQQKLQLYSPQPVKVSAPFSVMVGPPTGANLVIGFERLHDACVKTPNDCPQMVHDFVQETVADLPGAAAAAPPPTPVVPSDKDAFMAYLAAHLGALLPGAKVEADGMTLEVTRANGRAIPFDEHGYYQNCAEAEFHCEAALEQALRRTADWLVAPDVPGLRASLHIMASCSVIASVGNSISCKVTPSREPMAPFFRKAFANLETVCFKPTPGGDMAPVTNADRKDLGLDIDAALDLCEKSTHDALGPFQPAPPGADGVGRIDGPYAASRALFAADWAGLVAETGGHLLIAVPQRDLILYTKGDGPAEIAALAARAPQAAMISGMGISMDVYRWNGDGWSLATDRSVMIGGPPVTTDVMPRVH